MLIKVQNDIDKEITDSNLDDKDARLYLEQRNAIIKKVCFEHYKVKTN